MIGLIACTGTANRIFNLPKFILPLKKYKLFFIRILV